MSQTLEEAAREYASCDISEGGLTGLRGIEAGKYEPFIAGAQWQAKQSTWISVNEQLPEDVLPTMRERNWITGVLEQTTHSVFVLWKSGVLDIDHRIRSEDSEWVWGHDPAGRGRVTHWMPIPKINE